MEARSWEACAVLFLSLSPSFSVSLTCGFRLLTCLSSMCVCVCVCVCVFTTCEHARSHARLGLGLRQPPRTA